jgi:hypothetical protein
MTRLIVHGAGPPAGLTIAYSASAPLSSTSRVLVVTSYLVVAAIAFFAWIRLEKQRQRQFLELRRVELEFQLRKEELQDRLQGPTALRPGDTIDPDASLERRTMLRPHLSLIKGDPSAKSAAPNSRLDQVLDGAPTRYQAASSTKYVPLPSPPSSIPDSHSNPVHGPPHSNDPLDEVDRLTAVVVVDRLHPPRAIRPRP